jgi:hypothetical protein
VCCTGCGPFHREAEFAGSTRLLCAPAHAAALCKLEVLSLYGNKLTKWVPPGTVNAPRALIGVPRQSPPIVLFLCSSLNEWQVETSSTVRVHTMRLFGVCL